MVIDGPDGCGKTEQAKRLVARIGQEGAAVRHLREPGSTPVGERLRELLLDSSTGDLAPWTEALLFYAARAELLRREIEPALANGEHVVVERCYLSTLVYQGVALQVSDLGGTARGGAARGCDSQDGVASPGAAVDLGLLDRLTEAVHAATRPDLLLVLDVAPEVAAHRRAARGDADRIESRGEEYLQRVRIGFRELAEREPAARVLDANVDRDTVAAMVWAATLACLKQRSVGPQATS